MTNSNGTTQSTSNGDFEPSPLHVPTLHITAHNSEGLATIASSENPKSKIYPEHRFTSTPLYTTSAMPADLNDDIDLKLHHELLASGKLGIVQPNGTVLRYADFAPGSSGFMHRTQSLDFGIVLEGTVNLELDDKTTTTMTRGDVAIQRATMHAWNNPSKTEWARILFVLQDCKPLTVNGKVYGDDLGDVGGGVKSREIESSNE